MKAPPTARTRLYVDHPDFHKPDAERTLFPDGETLPILPAIVHLTDDALLSERVNSAPLSCAEERRRFLQYNYARWRATKAGNRGSRWANVACHLCEYLARANMLLIGYAYTKRRDRLPGVTPDDAYSCGMGVLLRCINGFDVSRGFKFSTYAVRAILNELTQTATRAARNGSHLSTGELSRVEGHAVQRFNHEYSGPGDVEALRIALAENTAKLTVNEMKAIKLRFFDGMLFEDSGWQLGVSKERVRQIVLKAQRKLLAVLATED